MEGKQVEVKLEDVQVPGQEEPQSKQREYRFYEFFRAGGVAGYGLKLKPFFGKFIVSDKDFGVLMRETMEIAGTEAFKHGQQRGFNQAMDAFTNKECKEHGVLLSLLEARSKAKRDKIVKTARAEKVK